MKFQILITNENGISFFPWLRRELNGQQTGGDLLGR